MNHAQKRTLIAVAAVTLVTAACAKKKVAAAPPPPPAPAAVPAATPKPVSAAPAHATAVTRPSATTPATKYPSAVTRARIDELLAKIEDAYFDYDKYSIRPDAMKALQADSTELRDRHAQGRRRQRESDGQPSFVSTLTGCPRQLRYVRSNTYSHT
jgi:outer membrane protein OmpA-like peptidoglycan-associated protein